MRFLATSRFLSNIIDVFKDSGRLEVQGRAGISFSLSHKTSEHVLRYFDRCWKSLRILVRLGNWSGTYEDQFHIIYVIVVKLTYILATIYIAANAVEENINLETGWYLKTCPNGCLTSFCPSCEQTFGEIYDLASHFTR